MRDINKYVVPTFFFCLSFPSHCSVIKILLLFGLTAFDTIRFHCDPSSSSIEVHWEKKMPNIIIICKTCRFYYTRTPIHRFVNMRTSLIIIIIIYWFRQNTKRLLEAANVVPPPRRTCVHFLQLTLSPRAHIQHVSRMTHYTVCHHEDLTFFFNNNNNCPQNPLQLLRFYTYF